ncbi:MAG: Rrf2 family transcriptional regulator [Armatimonadota bacterium]|nr:Rrf2 family transcriptional regulator [Armatimonadota bacterium]
MELIRRNTGYGLRALLHMVARGDDEVASAEELADAADTTVDFMHKIMQSLRDGGIVTSKRGPGGGFRLAREPEEIDLLEVVMAVQGPFEVNRCVMGLDVCERAESCPLRPTWVRIQEELEEGLRGTSLAEIDGLTDCAKTESREVPCVPNGDLSAD